MIAATVETVVGAAVALIGFIFVALKWLVSRAIATNDSTLEDHETRIRGIERTYVPQETLRIAITEIKGAIDSLGSDMRHSVDDAHARLDTIYNELLKRGT